MLGARYSSGRVRRSAIHLILKSPDSLAELIDLALLLLDHSKYDIVRGGWSSRLLQLGKGDQPIRLRWGNHTT